MPCSHCRNIGHTITVCNQAYADGRDLDKSVLDIMYANRQHNQEYIMGVVNFYLNSLTLHQLKIISIIHRQLNIFASNLYHNYLITLSQTAYRTKKDLLVVLGYYYLNVYLRYQLRHNREEVIPQLIQFQRPAINRPYGQNQPILNPKKFAIETKLVASNKEAKFECPICYDEMDDCKRVTTNCNHDVCCSCMDTYLTGLSEYNFRTPLCCMCRVPINSISFTEEETLNTIKNKLIV